jgi:hypothetical protein
MPYKSKVIVEEKLHIVEDCLAGKRDGAAASNIREYCGLFKLCVCWRRYYP